MLLAQQPCDTGQRQAHMRYGEYAIRVRRHIARAALPPSPPLAPDAAQPCLQQRLMATQAKSRAMPSAALARGASAALSRSTHDEAMRAF